MSGLGGDAAAALVDHLKSFLISSDFVFLPEGVNKVKKIFDKRMGEESIFAKLDYKCLGHFFEIICSPLDFQQALKICLSIYTAIIETEVGDGYSKLESNLIALLPQDLNEDDPGEVENSAEVEPIVTTSEELVPINFSLVWQCQTLDLSMNKIIPKNAQAEIEAMTHTTLYEDLNSQAIHVTAQTQESCDQAVHKLDILRKYHDLACRHVIHIFFTEERDNFQVCVKLLQEVNKKLVETTLLDPCYATWKHEELNKAYTIRCCPYQHIRSTFVIKSGEKLDPVVPYKDFDHWAGYHYPGMGGELLKHLRATDSQKSPARPLESAVNVRSWLATGIPDDPKESFEQMEKDMQLAEQSGTSSPTELIGPGDFSRERSSNTPQETEQHFTDSPGRHPMASINDNALALRPANETKDFLGICPGRRSIFRSPAMRDLRNAGNSTSENIRCRSEAQSLLDHDIQEDERVVLSNIDISTHSTTFQSSAASNTGNDHGLEFFLNPYCSQSLLDNDIPESERRSLKIAKSAKSSEGDWLSSHRASENVLPSVREETEVESRTFHEIMRQGAPRIDQGEETAPLSPPTAKIDKGKGKAPLSLPVPTAFANLILPGCTKEFEYEMEAGVYHILASLRNWQGDITLKCNFGRILVKPLHPLWTHTIEKPRSHPAENIRDLLFRNPGKVDFTRCITTLPAEIQFLLDTKITGTDQQMWGEAEEWTVTYEYICCDHEDYDGNCATGFVIEMDADSFKTNVASPPFNFGDINVHCTLRNWDYLISASGSKNLEEDYSDVAQAIRDSTYIAPGFKKVSMSFELSERYPIHFQSIRVRRHSQYKSYDGKTLLNVTEVHDLDINWEQGQENNIFFATSSDEPMSMWYEMNIESVEAKAAFKDNVNLEFGEETEWLPELLLLNGVVVKDICIPANYLITQMDGVGFYNDNGNKPLLPDVESIASTKPPLSKRPGYQFW